MPKQERMSGVWKAVSDPDADLILRYLGEQNYIFGFNRTSIGMIAAATGLSVKVVMDFLFGEYADTYHPTNCISFERGHRTGEWVDPDHTVIVAEKLTAHCNAARVCEHTARCPIQVGPLVDAEILPFGYFDTDRQLLPFELRQVFSHPFVKKSLAEIIRTHQKERGIGHEDEFGFMVLYNAQTTEVRVVEYGDNGLSEVKPTLEQLQTIVCTIIDQGFTPLFHTHLHWADQLTTHREEILNPLAPSTDDILSGEELARLLNLDVKKTINVIFNVLGKNKIRMLWFQHSSITLKLKVGHFYELEDQLAALGNSHSKILQILRQYGFVCDVLDFDLRMGFQEEQLNRLNQFC